MISQVSVLHGLHWVFFFWAKEIKRVKQTKQFLPQNRRTSPGGRLEQEYCCSYTATDGHCRYCAFVTCVVFGSCYFQLIHIVLATCFNDSCSLQLIHDLHTITAAMTTRVTTPAPLLPATTSPGTPRYCAQNTLLHIMYNITTTKNMSMH